MPPNIGWEKVNLARVKNASKLLLKKFGPLIVTGLVAIAEHHWLGHEDEADNTKAKEEVEEPDARPSIRKLEREVSELKRFVSRKSRDHGERSNAAALPKTRAEIVRECRAVVPEEQVQEHIRGRPLSDNRHGSSFYEPYEPHQQIPVAQQTQPFQWVEAPAQFVQVQEREHVRTPQRQYSVQPRRRRRHRHSSVPCLNSHDEGIPDEAIHAEKVAALAGTVEFLHMYDRPGEWIGPKGLRVGTTMAASYAASRSRETDPADYRRREVITDVGAGLLVSRLIHGPSRRLETKRLRERGRRWSYCY